MRFLLFICCLLSGGISAQTTISGTVTDSSKVSLTGANVVLLKQQDSTLVAFDQTNSKGHFALEGIMAGQYLIRCSFLGHQRPEQLIEINASDQLLDLGELKMYPANFLLDGIEVSGQRIPIRMRGDTMVFDADAFAAGPNAVVEDLLRRLPGMTIDASGAILFNGKSVKEVMINGKPFFRGNSKMITQNLDAAAVETVAVFDQKSDHEIVSGVEDGQENITVNLAIKESAKNQPFGQLYGGIGFDKRYQAGGKAFKIGDRSQMGLLSLFNNTNQTGFDPGTVLGWSTTGDFQLNGGNQGQIPVSWGPEASGDNRTNTAGLNYGTSLGERTDLALSYVLLDRKKRLDAFEQDVYQNSFINQTSSLLRQSNTSNYAHRVTIDLDTKADSIAGFDLQLAAYTTGQNQQEKSDGNLINQDSTLAFTRFDQLDEQRAGLSLKAAYSRRLGKKGRTLSFEQNAKMEKQQQSIYNEQTGFTPSLLTGISADNRLDQAYLLPLKKSESAAKITLPLLQQLRWNNEVNLLYSEDVLDIDFLDIENNNSNYFLKNQQLRSGLKSTIEWEFGKTNLSVGTKLLSLNWQLEGDIQRKTNRYFWLPQARYRLTLKNGTYQLLFRSDILVPQSSSLQDVARPSGGFNLLLGNADLLIGKQFNLINFFYYGDDFSGLNGSIQLRNSYTDKAIGHQLNITSEQQRIQLINIAFRWEHNLRFNIEQRLDFMNANIGLKSQLHVENSPTIVNNLTTQSQTRQWQVEGSISEHLNKKSFIRLAYLHAWSRSQLGKSNDFTENSLSRLGLQLQLEFSQRWRFETDFNRATYYGWRRSNTLLQWQATIEVRPFTKAAHYFSLSAHDILNQNAALTQEAQQFLVRSRRTNALGRYLLLTMHWKL